MEMHSPKKDTHPKTETQSLQYEELDNKKIGVEHHAVIFALLAKDCILAKGQNGEKTILEAVARYGQERGQRMAFYAQENGDACNPVTYQIYSEWRSETGKMKAEAGNVQDKFMTQITVCDWCEAWKKYDLLAYGKYYCQAVDKNLYYGFNPQLQLEILSTLSHGAQRCAFCWGPAFTTQDYAFMQKRMKAIGDRYIRGFSYHSAHILSTVSKKILEDYAQEGQAIIKKARDSFVQIFGIAILSEIDRVMAQNF